MAQPLDLQGWEKLLQPIVEKADVVIALMGKDRNLEYFKVATSFLLGLAGIVSGAYLAGNSAEKAEKATQSMQAVEDKRLQLALAQEQRALAQEDRGHLETLVAPRLNGEAIAQLLTIADPTERRRKAAELLKSSAPEQQALIRQAVAIEDPGTRSAVASITDPAQTPEQSSVLLSNLTETNPEAASIAASLRPEATQAVMPNTLLAIKAAEFDRLLHDLEFGASKQDRIYAVEQLLAEWQDYPELVPELIKAAEGRIQVWTPAGVNVRLINTMDLMRKLDASVLQRRKDEIEAFLAKVLGNPDLGPITRQMADSLKRQIDSLPEK